MRTSFFSRTLYATKVVLVLLFAVGAVYGTWLTKDFVGAYLETKTVHVFPTVVESRGWVGHSQVLAQEVAPNGTFIDFTRDIAAYILVAGAATSTSPAEPQLESSAAPIEVESEQSVEPTPEQESVVAPESPEPQTPEPQSEPVGVPDAPASIIDGLSQFAERKTSDYGIVGHTALATTVPDTTDAPVEETAEEAAIEPLPEIEEPENVDVPVCEIHERDCYTVEVSGFALGGSITDTVFEKVSLGFSFAGRSDVGESAVDDRLLVRYFDDGVWRQAGEIYLNKELSNAANGGYFTSALDGVDSWTDLADVRVVVEYARENSNADTELYLDAVWLSADYTDRAQQVLEGTTDLEGVPENVLSELADDGGVTLESGERVSFAFTDDVAVDTLEMRTSQKSFKSFKDGKPGKRRAAERAERPPEYVYVSVTNTSLQEDTFQLFAAFPGGAGSVTGERYLRNIATEEPSVTYEDVTYFCESGWATTTPNVCAATGESFQCSELSETGENCLVRNVAVPGAAQVVYENRWVPVAFTPVAAGALN
ncbi:MAG: hypothetical protein NBV63_01560, partial [Candidatus Pacebacteria bacterium]|nr:hypothetical protein [Candidatus Paceibacterota bacterium]